MQSLFSHSWLRTKTCVAAIGDVHFSVRSSGCALFYFEKSEEARTMKKAVICISVICILLLSSCTGFSSSYQNYSNDNTAQNQETPGPCQNGHASFDALNETSEATYIYPTAYQRGTRTYKCSRCGEYVKEELPSFKERVDPYLEEVVSKLQDNLVDPYSLKYEGKVYIRKPTDTIEDSPYYGSAFMVMISYNAKNRMGGYAGYTSTMASISKNTELGMDGYPTVDAGGVWWNLHVSYYSDKWSGKYDRFAGDDRYQYLYSFSNE